MDYQRIGLILALALIVLLLARTLRNRNKDQTSAISLDDLLLGDDGKMSKAAIVMLGSFGLTSWVILYLTLNDKLTDIIFGAYLTAWVVPTVAKLIKAGQPDASA